MAFGWLNNFQQKMEKPDNYAEKTLAAYKLGMKAGGSIVGVKIEFDRNGCQACRQLNPLVVYLPEEAPHLPLPDCDREEQCGCIYRPVMTYQTED